MILNWNIYTIHQIILLWNSKISQCKKMNWSKSLKLFKIIEKIIFFFYETKMKFRQSSPQGKKGGSKETRTKGIKVLFTRKKSKNIVFLIRNNCLFRKTNNFLKADKKSLFTEENYEGDRKNFYKTQEINEFSRKAT